MTPRYMLDTNICIYLIKHQPPAVRARFAECFLGEVVMSAITLAELEFGVTCSGDSADQNRTALRRLCEEIRVVPFEASAAAAYGLVRAAARERNRDALDKLIAAHAISLGVVLVTNNGRDFEGYPGIRLENWVAAL